MICKAPLSPAKGLVACLAVVLMGLALWQGIDSVVRLYGEASVDLTLQDRPQALADDTAVLEGLDDWLGDPHARIRSGLLNLRLAVSMHPGSPPDHDRLARAIDDLSEGLARAPADARGWTALAYARLAAGDLVKGKLAFRTALLTALYDPTLTLWRCQLGLGLWPMLDAQDQQLVANQLRMAWTRQPDELVALGKAGNNATVIAAALAQDPVQKKAFEKALGR